MTEREPAGEDVATQRQKKTEKGCSGGLGVSVADLRYGHQVSLRNQVGVLAEQTGYPLVHLHRRNSDVKNILFGKRAWTGFVSRPTTARHRLKQAFAALQSIQDGRRQESQS